jgi:5-methylcytosine-specific restriction enzyme subunit McrC
MNAGVPIYEVGEWKERLLPGFSLTYKDRQLAQQIGGEEGQIEILELQEGIRIRANSWVGVVRFEDFQLSITPKLAGDHLGLVDMLTFTLGTDAFRRNKGLRDLQFEKNGSLLDLLALLLVEECEAVVNGGLLYDYIDQEDDLPVLRGRLLVKPQVRNRLGRLDRIECRFDDHSSDIVENQVLSAAVYICGKFVSSSRIRRRLHRLNAIFSAVCNANIPDLSNARSLLTYNRLNARYQDAHELSWLIFDGLGIQDLFSSGSTRCFAFLLDMNQLFELFVFRYLEWIFKGTGNQVNYQQRNKSILWNVTDNRSYGNIIPDLLVDSSDRQRMVIDAKYKLYDDRKVSSSDIYQSFLYAYAFGNEGFQPRAFLLYPSHVNTTPSLSLQVRNFTQIARADLHVIGIHIPQAISEVKHNTRGSLSGQLLDFMSA